ncbi:hypothetical protein GCM10009733_049460 [Nonomuraea maheshkhaliensis]|uniref:Uncharacterized protein n=1 Tax=Nonomuraea maheshkhaliensis TaxID=419590 RepID=A0ABN2FGW9_9ACTN
MVASHEARVHPEHHRRLVAATGDGTVLTSIFGPEFPRFNPMRLQRNRVVAEWNDRVAEIPADLDPLGGRVRHEAELPGAAHEDLRRLHRTARPGGQPVPAVRPDTDDGDHTLPSTFVTRISTTTLDGFGRGGL